MKSHPASPLLKFSVLLLACIIPFFSFSQLHLSGTVRNGITGESVSNASVVISDLHTGTQTNDSGYFSFQNKISGVHLVEISHVEFRSQVVNVDFSSAKLLDIFLQPSIVENAAVVVTGIAKASDSRKVPFQVDVIRKEDLQQQPVSSIVEHLAGIPGITSLSSGPAVSKPMIRGLGYNRVLVIHDGVRQEGQQWGDEHGLEIAAEGVEKIEVLKGPASLVYGSDAMAGVINIISDVDIPGNVLQAKTSAGFQSNSRSRYIQGDFGFNRNGYVFHVNAASKAAADYRNVEDGDVFNSKFRQQNAGFTMGVHRKWGFSHLRVSYFNLLTGMVEGARDSLGRFVKETPNGEVPVTADENLATRPLVPYQHIRHSKISSDNNFLFGKKRLYVNVGYQQNRRSEYGTVGRKLPSLDFELNTLTWVTRFHLVEKRKWELTIGTNGMRQHNSNLGEEKLIPAYTLTEGGLFSYLRKTKGNATFSGGLRYDLRKVSTEIDDPGFERTFRSFSGSLGIATAFSKKFVLKANVSRAYRAPSISELASDGAHEGTIRYEYGNRALRNETSWQTDVAFEYTSPHLAVNVASFCNFFENYIFYRKLSSVNGSDSIILNGDEELMAFTFSQRKAMLTGMEASIDIHPHPLDWLHIKSSFAIVRGRFFNALDGSRNLPFMPAPRWMTELRGELKSRNSTAVSYIKFEYENVLAQNHPFNGFATETNTAGYSLFHAGIGSSFGKPRRQKFTLHLAVRNIFNTIYQDHLSRLKYTPVNPFTGKQGISGMGRNFTISLTVPIQQKL